ncbi:MAG: hypothetical protein JJ858_17455 [Rhizobiaceae bacterium]|nr:hypothetical protein [Rhizobiaceae bacterium]
MKHIPDKHPPDREAGGSVQAMEMVDDARLYASESAEEAKLKQRHAEQFDRFESYHFHSRMDLESTHAYVQRLLEEDQRKRSGEDMEAWRNEQDSLEQNLQIGGIHGWWRNITGRNEADQAALEGVQKSLEAATYRQEQELNALKNTQAQQMKAREADEASRRKYVENEQTAEREAFQQKQREQSLEALENTTISNDYEKPEYAIEQDNLKTRVSQSFNQSAPTPAVDLRAEYIAAQIDPTSEVSQDRNAYIAEQQDYVDEQPVDRATYIAEQQNEPSQDFQQAAQVEPNFPNR